MKVVTIFLIVAGALALAGCASYQGGTSDEYGTNFDSGGAPASPTYRPGSSPDDMRDPNALTMPKPHPLYPPGPTEQP